MKKKAQMGIRELMMTLVVAGLLGIIGLLIFSNVSNNIESVFDRDTLVISGETVAISSGAGQLAHGALETEEFTTLQGFGNITLVGGGVNITAAGVVTTNYSDGNYIANYTYLSDTDAISTKETLDTTILDSFELGVIALIVLAAVAILGALFFLGR